MTAVSYPTRPAFASLPLRIAAARASASLYLVNGEELVRDYIQSEQQRVVSTLCLPAQASAPRIDLNAVRTPTRVLKARYQLTHPAVIKSGPAIALQAWTPTTPSDTERVELDLTSFIRAMKQAIEAEAALIDCDRRVERVYQSESRRLLSGAFNFLNYYLNHYGLFYSASIGGVCRYSDQKLLYVSPAICLPAPASDKPMTLIEDVQTLIRSIHQWDGSTRYLSTRKDLWVSRGTQGDIYLYQTKPGKYTPPERLGVVGWLGGDGYTPAPKDRIERALKAVA